jgi:hypothetical protein
MPDFMTPLNSMAQSLGRMAGRSGRPADVAAVSPQAEILPAAHGRPIEQRRA